MVRVLRYLYKMETKFYINSVKTLCIFHFKHHQIPNQGDKQWLGISMVKRWIRLKQ